ncbi:MAG TPA: universal stress protein [Mycobacterium sp.]|uniref:universal stress protein n=1 Tax=Mycobacterium sp. TaxID=1785 RepID=UPI002BFC20BD|nr:universal stress protein [Mycobacterium sp.]HME80388.1 universal stress protein [Mycobacterium sp.]
MSSAEAPRPAVVGIDGSDAAIEAARWAAKEAVHQDVPLRLVHVVPITDGPIASTAAYPAEEDYAESSLRAACLAVESTGLPVKIDTAVLYDDVDSALIAESNNASIICLGSVGIGRVANMVLGSTAATLAEYAHCPVAIIRRTGGGPLPEAGFIAVVVDDQPGKDDVMQWAIEEARARRAPVLALRVGHWGHRKSGDERFYRRLDGWLRRYPDVEVEVAITRLGLARYLQGYIGAVQLVVIDSEHANRAAQLVGPHSLPIFAHADCSVLIVRDKHQ